MNEDEFRSVIKGPFKKSELQLRLNTTLTKFMLTLDLLYGPFITVSINSNVAEPALITKRAPEAQFRSPHRVCWRKFMVSL